MPATADTTTIALALGAARSLARQVASIGGNSGLKEIALGTEEAIVQALGALKRIEDGPPPPRAVPKPGEPGTVLLAMGAEPRAGAALAFNDRGKLVVATPGAEPCAWMIEDSNGSGVLYVDLAAGRAANTREALMGATASDAGEG